MELITIVLVLASSLVTVPIVYVLDKLAFLKQQQSFFIGIVVCVSLAAAAVLPALVLRRRYRHVDWAIYGMVQVQSSPSSSPASSELAASPVFTVGIPKNNRHFIIENNFHLVLLF